MATLRPEWAKWQPGKLCKDGSLDMRYSVNKPHNKQACADGTCRCGHIPQPTNGEAAPESPQARASLPPPARGPDALRTQLSSCTVAELRQLAVMRGIKQTGVGWPRCCPPDGNKAAIVDALVTRAGGGGSVDISDPGTAERSRMRSRLTPAAADGALPFTADTPLAKLRTFIDAQNLNVSMANMQMDFHQHEFMAKQEEEEEWEMMEDGEDDRPMPRKGGLERAPMSTTSSLKVACEYAAHATSPKAVLFKIKTDNFRQRGADIAWVSAFKGEDEILFPPLTFLQPTGATEVITSDHGRGPIEFTVIEVKPDID